MNPILVVSVPHSGTMFTWELMPGSRGHFPSAILHGFERGRKYYAHLREPGMKSAIDKCVIVIPQRSRNELVKSWERRGMDLKDLANQLDDLSHIPGFRLPLDTNDRDMKLLELGSALGVCFRTDWQPINSVEIMQ